MISPLINVDFPEELNIMKPVKLIVIGAGDRGTNYANYALRHPDLAKVIVVAELRDYYRDRIATQHNIPIENTFADWRELIEKNIEADGVIIATQDSQHLEPAVAFADKGYNILLEKPMAPDEDSCRKIVAAAIRNKIIFAVCHVLRYTNYTVKLKEIIDSGAIGEVISMQHLEPVGFLHQAHSYVRGNWRKESESSSMLLAKSCHDLDWIRYIMNCECKKVSSFGSLYYFRKENKPAGSADRCLDCGIESECLYSAKKFYLNYIKKGETGWPIHVITSDATAEGVLEALQTGPYGRCVWECDNDVVDNQVVNMEFEGGRTAGFTMTAFTEGGHRKTRIFGSMGEISGDGSKIEVYSLKDDKWTTYQTDASDAGILGGHGGGDYNIMKSFTAALADNDPGKILSGPAETLETHFMTFAAEKARRTGRVVEVKI